MIKKIIMYVFIGFFIFLPSMADVIKNYHVDVTVLEDGSIDVIETIEMDIDHQDVRLGIIRDIPIYYYFGNSIVDTHVRVLSVTINGEPENYWIEAKGRMTEIFTGAVKNHPDNYIPKGSNIYKIHWTSPNHIRGFMDYDELYFNAIGNSWEFPIEKASVTLHLPDSVKVIQSAGYYGYSGSQSKAIVQEISPMTINFIASEPIGNRKGLTIATGFSKGVVQAIELPFLERLQEKILSYFPNYVYPVHIVFSIIIIVMLTYVSCGLIAYKRLKPKSERAFMVRFSPPSFSLDKAIALIAIKESIKKDRMKLSLLMDLVQKEIVIFHKNKKEFLINKDKQAEFDGKLTQGQGDFLYAIQEDDKKIVSYDQHNPLLTQAFSYLADSVQIYLNLFYYSVLPYFKIIGIAIFLICVFIFYDVMDWSIYLSIFFIDACIIALYWLTKLFFKGLSIRNIIFRVALVPFIILLMIILPFEAIYYSLKSSISNNNIISYVLMFVLCLIFLFVLLLFGKIKKSIKKEYFDAQQQVLEFKHFLQYTKEDEYKIISPDIFEEYLPYAIAFGVEESWLKRYQEVYPKQYNDSLQFGNVAVHVITISNDFKVASSPVVTNDNSSSYDRDHDNWRDSGSSSGSGGRGSSGGGSGGGGGRGR